MEIGEPKETEIIEPMVNPVPDTEPAPVPEPVEPERETVPAEDPDREKVPA